MNPLRHVVDGKNVVHVVSTWPKESTHGLTCCLLPWTYNKDYAAPWPDNRIVVRMQIAVDTVPTCVWCAVRS